MMRCALLLLFALIIPLVPGTRVSGQIIRGQAVEQETEQPLSGAFIILLDEQGTRRSAVLTDSAGNFIVRAPGAGRYTLVMERIGYRSTTSTVLELAAFQTLIHRFSAPIEPVTMEGISASGTGRCNTPREIGAATSQLWEEARKALSISEWVRADRNVAYQWLRFERVRDLVSLDMKHQKVWFRSGYGTAPFESPSAKDLAMHGYVRSLPGEESSYFGLDAPTLLSDDFLATHCFRIRNPGREEEGLIGLGFEPIPTHHLPDIAGVLWLDRGTSEVRYVEFQFTQHLLPIPLPLEPFGGRIEFRRLANGAWVVDRWWLRMPQMESTVVRRLLGREVRPTDTARDSLIEGHRSGVRIWEEGGEVRFAAQPGPNANGRASVEGVVYDFGEARPLGGARVFLTGTPRSARTDADGRFLLNNVPDGANEIAFVHPRADSLGLLVSPRPIVLTLGERTWVDLSIPEGIGCPDRFEDPEKGGITGLAFHAAGGDPVPGARVSAEWFGSGTSKLGQREVLGQTTVRTNGDGRFLFCSIPLGDVRLTLLQAVDQITVELRLKGMGIAQKDLVIH